MDLVTTSLDALLLKATNSNSSNVDAPAAEAFYAMINKEKDGAQIGAKLLSMRIHSSNQYQAMHTLTILDTCLKRCNNAFLSEIGKFRFLNEMIKLVSPKYLGTETPLCVKQKVLQLLYIWTRDYPKETKIKEAYDMLKKQGVIKEPPTLSVAADEPTIPERKVGNSIFNDEEKNKLLQKLLQSKNPEDLQAANRLIKNMVKEDAKRAEIKNRKFFELEQVHNNVRLLSEMLDSYKPGISSEDELELIKELQQSCERLKPTVYKLVTDSQDNEDLLKEVLQVSDDLGQVFIKYTNVIVKGTIVYNRKEANLVCLLDLGSSSMEAVGVTKMKTAVATTDSKDATDMDLLCDVFSSTNAGVADILKPITSNNVDKTQGNNEDVSNTFNKLQALDDLDALGEHLLKENLVSQRIGSQFNKVSDKIPMNLLLKQNSQESKITNETNGIKSNDISLDGALNLDLNYLVDKENKQDSNMQKKYEAAGDDFLVDITEDDIEVEELCNEVEAKKEDTKKTVKNSPNKESYQSPLEIKSDIKLTDIFIKLEEIKPSTITPLVVLDERNGITVTFHFGKNKPRSDVSVIVVTTISKNELALSNFLFQAVVPKTCKLKLQPPSGTDLPAHNPFLPPSAITQIMLIANPENKDASLKFIVSYTMDEETITEMGEVDSLPITNS